MDETAFRAKLATTVKHLDEAGRQAQPANPAAFAAAATELRRAATSLDELLRLCDAPERRQRLCPSCAKSGMAAARLCGYCWTKLTPVE